ncbi:MAG TPA: T9SS type A sorting domain-containing protein [Bacteroidales bacterium]|nr:T9SS type A sorting domain-containing protein [Bacteroidales bacterium]
MYANKNLFVFILFMLLIRFVNIAQTNANYLLSQSTPESKPEQVHIFFYIGVLQDSYVHLVWENYDSENIKEVILESGNDRINFTPCSEALISDLPDIHLFDYPTELDYYNNILMSTEHGNVRYIFNDVLKSRNVLVHPKFYRLKMRTFSGHTYVSQSVCTTDSGKDPAQQNSNTLLANAVNGENNSPSNEEPGYKWLAQNKTGTTCPPVGTPPAGYTPTSTTQTYYGDCCSYTETLYIQNGSPCGAGWCCDNVPEAASCPSGYAYDWCCVHHCSNYSSCSCIPWSCCTAIGGTQWVVTQSGPFPGNPTPAATPTVICGSGSSTLSASQAGSEIYWYTGSCGGTLIGTGSPIVVTPAVSTTYFVRTYNTSNGCWSPACGSITVTVTTVPAVPSPSVSLSTICAGTATNLSASVTGSIIYWYSGSCGAGYVGTGNSINVFPATTTTYYARAYNPSGCWSAGCGSVPVTVNAAATPTPAASPSAICLGSSSTLSASVTGSIVYWYTGSCGGTLIASGSPITVTPATTTTYYARSYNLTNGCWSGCAGVVITVWAPPANPSPTASPLSICTGNSSSLSATVTNSTIFWYTGSCGGSLIASGNTVSVTPVSTTTYYARAYNTSGCWSANCGSTTITVNPLPPDPSPAASPATICQGSSTNITASVAGATVYWYTGSCGGTLIGTGNSITVSPATTTTYYARAYSASGCWSAGCGNITITVNPLPANPSPTASPSAICAGASSNLSASVSGATINWYTGSCGGTLIASGSPVTVTPASTTTYFARAFNITSGCWSSGCLSTTVTVYSLPASPSPTASPASICPGSTTSLSASVSGATVYWYSGSCGGTFVASGSPVTVTLTSNSTFYARAYNATTGCWSSGCGNVSINVGTAQTIMGITPLCTSSAALWTSTNSGGTWTSSNPWIASVGSSTGFVSGIAAGTSVITYTVTVGGCVNTATKTVTIYGPVSASLSGGTTDVCYNTSPGTLSANASGGSGTYTYQWYISPSTMISNATNSTFNPGNITSAIGYYCAVTGSCGSAHSDTLTIIPSQITVIPDADTICTGDSVQLSASGGDTYTWSPANGLSSTNNAVVMASPSVTTTYYCSTPCGSSNLIYNGDFELGNTGFTTDYNLCPAATCNPSYYVVAPLGSALHAGWNYPDHTTSAGNYLIADGYMESDKNVWCQTVTVTPNTNYTFSCWAVSMNNTYGNCSGDLHFLFNGIDIGNLAIPITNGGPWANFSALWNSGSNTSVAICIVDYCTNYVGNDFGIDDISLIGASSIVIDSVTVVVGSTPVIAVTPPSTSICQGNSTNLAATTTGTDIYWYSGSCGGGILATGSPITVSPSTTTTYYARAYNDTTGCWSAGCGNIVVTVNALPAAPSPVAMPPTVCGNGSSDLSATITGATTYWYTGSCGGNFIGSGNVISVSPTSTTTYYARAYNSSGCWSGCDSVTVTYVTPGTVTITGPASACPLTDISYTATPSGWSGSPAYQWYITNADSSNVVTLDSSSVIGNAPLFTSYNGGMSQTLDIYTFGANYDHIHVYCVVTYNGCSATSNDIAMVNGGSSISQTITGMSPLCAGSATSWSSTTSGGTWTSSDPGVAAIDANTGSVTGIAAGTSIITYSVTIGSCVNTGTQTITITDPLPQTITGINLLCTGSTAAWASTTSGGTWASSNSAVAVIDPSTGSLTGVTAGTSEITYSVTTSGGCNNTATAAVTVAGTVSATISGGTSPICYNAAPGIFTSTGAGGTGAFNYQWFLSPSTIINNATNSTYSPGSITSNSGYYCIVSGSCGSASTDTTDIIVYPELTAGISGGTSPICEKTSPGIFTASGSGGTSIYAYQWYRTSMGIINGATNSTFNPGIMTSSNGFYCVVTSGSCGSASSPAFNVVVMPEVSTPAPIMVSAGTEPLCQLTNDTTTTTYNTSASNNLGFHWSISNPAAGSIDSSTGVMTWANGFYGTVNIQVYAYGCGLPSPQIIRTVTVNPCGTGHAISGKTRYAGKASNGNPAPNPPTYNSIKYNIDQVIVILKNSPSGTEIARDTSDALGVYHFSNVQDGNYILSYDKYTADTMQWGNDVNAIDLALVKYYIGSDTLSDPSRNFYPKYRKAANVDNNTLINAIDIARIKAKLGAPYAVSKNFPKGNWVALDTSVTVAGADLNITLKTICYGDYNASSSKYRDSLINWGMAKSLPINIIDVSDDYITTSDPEYFEIPLRISAKINEFSALGLELNYPSDNYMLVSASMPGTGNKNGSVKINPTMEEIIAADDDLLVTDENGVIRVVFATTDHFNVAANDEIIRLGFHSLHNMKQGPSGFILDGTGVIGNQYGEENEDAYLIMPRIFVQGSNANAGLEFAGYPNPFSGLVKLTYNIPEQGHVTIKVFNALGEIVAIPVNETQHNGRHIIGFSGTNLPAGIYSFKLEYDGPKKSEHAVLKIFR